MELLLNLVRFIVILGVLIFVHELGHFLVAKKVGIYVFKFSIGFGKRLFGWKRNGTDYCISAIPFGGYVKMAGQEDMPSSDDKKDVVDEDLLVDVPDDQKFCNKSVIQRLAVVIAGPLMNFMLGLVLFSIVYYAGMHVPVYMKKTVVGDVVENAPAQIAGIKTGDEIISIAGKPVKEWKEIVKTVLFNMDKQIDIEIKRDGQTIIKKITPGYYDKKSNPGIGVLPYIKSTVKEVIPNSPAFFSGIKPNDEIYSVNGVPVCFTSIINAIKFANSDVLNIGLIRGAEKRDVFIKANTIGAIKDIELVDRTVVTVDNKIYPNITIGDVIVDIDGQKISSDDQINGIITPKIGMKPEISFESRKSGLNKKKELIKVSADIIRANKIGVLFQPDQETVLEKYPIHISIIKGTQKTFGSVFEMFASLYYLVIGKISAKELAGPVGIYKITSEFAKSGFVMLLSFVAFLSVNLSVINLLPIPVLDGGHVVFLTIEGILRRPLNEKVVETCQKIGFALLMLLIVYTFYNDIVHRLIGK